MKKVGKLISKFFIAFATLLVMSLMAEIGLRWNSNNKQVPTIFRLSDQNYTYDLTPGFDGNFSDVPVKINKQGFRMDNDVVLEKPLGLMRILGIGDSIAFGYGINEKDVYLRKLEKSLNEERPGGYEVINAAVTGYNTFQEKYYLEKQLKYRPDLVVLGFVLNDYGGEFHVPNMVYRNLVPFKIGAESPPSMSRAEQWFYQLFRKSLFYQFIHPRIGGLWGFPIRQKLKLIGNYADTTLYFYKNGYYSEPYYVNAVSNTNKCLLDIRDMVEKAGAKFLVVIFPNDAQFNNVVLKTPQHNLMNFCRENGLHCLDLLPYFEIEKEPVLIDIGHPNALGGDIAARAILDYIRKNFELGIKN